MPGSDWHCPTRSLPLHILLATFMLPGDYFFAIDEVLNVIEDEHVDHVIVGLPLQMDGTEGKSAKKARRWAANLEKRLQAESEDSDSTEYQIPQVSLIDERLTTVSAHRQLFEAIKLRTSTRPVVDQQSAVVILQTALDRTREPVRYRL